MVRQEKSRKETSREYSILQQEIPVNLDFVAAPSTPTEAKHALASLFATGFGLAAMNIPHPERNCSGRVNDDFVFLPRTAQLFHLIGINIANVNVGVARHSRRDRNNGWSAGLCQADVFHNAVGKTRGEADLPTR